MIWYFCLSQGDNFIRSYIDASEKVLVTYLSGSTWNTKPVHQYMHSTVFMYKQPSIHASSHTYTTNTLTHTARQSCSDSSAWQISLHASPAPPQFLRGASRVLLWAYVTTRVCVNGDCIFCVHLYVRAWKYGFMSVGFMGVHIWPCIVRACACMTVKVHECIYLFSSCFVYLCIYVQLLEMLYRCQLVYHGHQLTCQHKNFKQPSCSHDIQATLHD